MRQVSRRRMRWGLVLLALALALAACGSGSAGTPSTTPTSCGTPASAPAGSGGSGSATPAGGASTGGVSQEHMAVGAVPTVAPVPSVTVTSGRLTVTADRGHYGPCAAIQAIIANGFESNIYVTDHHTSCGLLTLERQVGSAWQPQGRCALMTPTRLLEIRSGTAVAQRLVPGVGETRALGWPAGTYRLSLAYATGSSDHQVPQAPITSATFTIG